MDSFLLYLPHPFSVSFGRGRKRQNCTEILVMGFRVLMLIHHHFKKKQAWAVLTGLSGHPAKTTVV